MTYLVKWTRYISGYRLRIGSVLLSEALMANISKAGFFYLVFEFVNQAFVGLLHDMFLKDVCEFVIVAYVI